MKYYARFHKAYSNFEHCSETLEIDAIYIVFFLRSFGLLVTGQCNLSSKGSNCLGKHLSKV